MESKTLTDLLGFVETDVLHIDGQTERVRVRQLPVKDMPRYLAVLEDEPATVELFCDKPKGWAETLTPEAFNDIMTKGEGMNLDFLAQHAARVQRRREKIMPGFQEKILEAAISRLPSGALGSPLKPG